MKKEIESQEIAIINATKKQKKKLLSELDRNFDKVSWSLDNGNEHVQEIYKTLLQQEDHENNIGIVDNTSDDNRGRVMVLQENGELRNMYTSHSKEKSFKPYTTESTFSGNFVVLDLVNQNLHILNQKGRLITFCDVKEQKVGYIGAVCIRDSYLYIGCKAREKDRISIVDVSGW
ncbi:unnamed protein product [Mytilus coruscus]|uniref:TRIM2_3 n=1 Tax=Mytilus coruscus TaxID=42192 RepID=A0A6J8CB95_MYTCO|nr:unnamed protein product [Mytilus coruscus]